MGSSTVVDCALEKALRTAFLDLGVRVQETDQDNYAVRSHAFQKAPRTGSRGRTIAYVMFEDREHRGNACNLVFRFRKTPAPQQWFKGRAVSTLARRWASMFVPQWSVASGTPKRMLEARAATDQFGLAVTAHDLSQPDFADALKCFAEIAAEAVGQAPRRKTADWSRYHGLIS